VNGGSAGFACRAADPCARAGNNPASRLNARRAAINRIWRSGLGEIREAGYGPRQSRAPRSLIDRGALSSLSGPCLAWPVS
jgi:hypothetical protein